MCFCFRIGYNILRPLVEARGYNVSMATRLCELPCVCCMVSCGLLYVNDVGRGYELSMYVLENAKPAIFDPAIVKLRRINYLQMDMSAGPIETMTS